MLSPTIFVSIFFSVILAIYCKPSDYEFDTNRVTSIINRFGDNLLIRLGREPGNLLYSPSSVSIALSALYVGARGFTRRELGTLGYRELEQQGYSVPRSYQKLLESLQRDSDKYKLEIANVFLYEEMYPILKEYKEMYPTLEEYKDIIRSSYQALLKEVDMYDYRRAVDEVNNWVNEKTHGKITRLVDHSDISLFLLLNAVYFKGTWKTEFEKKYTSPRPFYNNGENGSKLVPIMKVKSKYPYLYDTDKKLRAIELPYKGEDISMVVLLPEERNGVYRLQNEISSDYVYDIIDRLKETNVTLYLPKFNLNYSTRLKTHLGSMCARSLLGGADLSGITGNKKISIWDVVHKAVVEVNEEGSEVTAVTRVISELSMLPRDHNVINADHPFLFYIIHKSTKTNMFVGRVNEL